jgi:hypothetical protein
MAYRQKIAAIRYIREFCATRGYSTEAGREEYLNTLEYLNTFEYLNTLEYLNMFSKPFSKPSMGLRDAKDLCEGLEQFHEPPAEPVVPVVVSSIELTAGERVLLRAMIDIRNKLI